MSTAAEFDTYTPHPRYECTRGGVYHIGIKTDKEGNTSETPPVWLSDPIRLIGRGTDGTGSHYRIIEWKDRLTGAAKQAAVPSAEIGSVQGWQRLQSYGLTILSGRAKRERLADYLQTEGENTHYAVTARAGWHGAAYILPSGEVIRPGNAEAGRVIYNGDKSQAPAYEAAGTAQEWNTEIGQYLTGNSRLCLAVGTALAAPLIGLLGMEAGGFHLFGDSRDGKSTAARIALSIWGNPAALMQTWTGTAHGFTNLANALNDGLLVLDEIGQANARQVSQTAYSVINGVSKVQGAKEGGNRESTRWKTLLFSTGEKPLDAFIRRHGEDWNAGQAARLPSIPSNAGQGLGIYDRLHGFPHRTTRHHRQSLHRRPTKRPRRPSDGQRAAKHLHADPARTKRPSPHRSPALRTGRRRTGDGSPARPDNHSRRRGHDRRPAMLRFMARTGGQGQI